VALTESISRTAQRMSEAARDVLLGISTYTQTRTRASMTTLEDIEQRREDIGGGLLPPPSYTPTRWYLADLEAAERLADQGDLRRAAQLMLAARKDGHLAGVLSTRTGGLVRLPRVFRGDADAIARLERGHDSTRAEFDEMCPPSELALLAADGILLGVGVGELIPVRNRAYPVLVRYDPQFLRYVWQENTWYYQSYHGVIRIVPGDGRWVLHTPGGRVAPWQAGLWRAIGQAWIRKQHAGLYRDHWEAKLAHPARVATAPQGASEPQKQSHFRQVMAWGVNTVFGMTPGYEVKLLESNGRGWESFTKTIEECNTEFNIAIAGQVVTIDGGAGFSNAETVHKAIASDLIKETGDGISHTLNTQILPQYVACVYGTDQVLKRRVTQEYDVTPPKDRNQEASAMVQVSAAIKQLSEALAPSDLMPNVRQLVDRFGIPVEAIAPDQHDGIPDNALDAGQITSLLAIATACAEGQIPRDAAQQMIARAFSIDDATAGALLGSIGMGFVPAAPTAPVPPPGAPAPPALPPPAPEVTP
jgi:phage gp29-like protein